MISHLNGENLKWHILGLRRLEMEHLNVVIIESRRRHNYAHLSNTLNRNL